MAVAAPVPVRVETFLHEADAQARLRAVGASYDAGKSTRGRYVYWIGRTKSWATIERAPGGAFSLAYWSVCPCD